MTDKSAITSSPSVGSLEDEAIALSVVGRLLQTYPDQKALPWFEALADEHTLPGLRFITESASASNAAKDMDQWLQELKVCPDEEKLRELQFDYTRLFVGPGTPLAPPWESVQVTGEELLFQPVTREVRNWYRRFGLHAEHLDREPDDHLGLELSFLGVLAARTMDATSDRERDALRQASSDFWHQHPACWVGKWTDQVSEHARHPFTQGLGKLVRGVAEAMSIAHPGNSR